MIHYYPKPYWAHSDSARGDGGEAQQPSQPPGRYLRLAQIIGPAGILPISRSGFYLKVKAGEIPPPLKLGPRISVWRESDILDFIEGKGASNDG